jgi:hypothetical protein
MSRKSSVNKIKRDNSKSKNIEASLCMYLYEKSHSPIEEDGSLKLLKKKNCIKSQFLFV